MIQNSKFRAGARLPGVGISGREEDRDEPEKFDPDPVPGLEPHPPPAGERLVSIRPDHLRAAGRGGRVQHPDPGECGSQGVLGLLRPQEC